MNGFQNNNERTEYMTEMYNLTKDDLDGVDLIRFMKDYEIGLRNWTPAEIKQILLTQKKYYIDDGSSAVFCIFSCDGRKYADGDVIKKIGIYMNEGTKIGRVVIDIDEAKYYLNSAEPKTFDKKWVPKLKNIPERFGVIDWEPKTTINGTSTASFSWKIVFETTRNEYCVYSGYSSDPAKIPVQLKELIELIHCIV